MAEGKGLAGAARLGTGAERRWLVTGAAGFIGSHLVENLLRIGQSVVGLDNFATGKRANLDDVAARVGREGWARFRFIEGDIRNADDCRAACEGVDLVLHQAALGSVPRSIANPQATHATNVTGFLTMLEAARAAGVGRFVYASSSSVYGSEPNLPKVEDRIGDPLSPYAVSKLANELYAKAFARCYGMELVGLRYFNVFGARQDPEGQYAAVIPRWIAAITKGEPVVINGDGETTRDFCFVDNVVQANLRAALVTDAAAVGTVYNVAVGGQTSLNTLHRLLKALIAEQGAAVGGGEPVHGPFREGDVRHSHADVSRARRLLGYSPDISLEHGLRRALPWYLQQLRAPA